MTGENAERNLELVHRLRSVAAARNGSVQDVAFAWVRSRGKDIMPLIGARRRDQLEQALAGLALTLTESEVEEIERAVPAGSVAGTRNATSQMAALDSERQ